MRQTRAKLNWYKINENVTGIHQSATFWKTATSALTKEMSKPWSEAAVIQFCHHKEQQFYKIMSEGYPNGPHLKKKRDDCPYSSLRSLTW